MKAFRELLSKDTLTLAGGVVLSDLVTSWIIQNYGPVVVRNGVAVPNDGFKLPGSDSQYGLMAYSVAIPVGASVLVHKFSPKLSQGLIISGALLLIKSVLHMVQSGTNGGNGGNGATQGTSAYLRRGTIRALPGSPPGYSAVRAFGGALDNSNAFKGAWSR